MRALSHGPWDGPESGEEGDVKLIVKTALPCILTTVSSRVLNNLSPIARAPGFEEGVTAPIP